MVKINKNLTEVENSCTTKQGGQLLARVKI